MNHTQVERGGLGCNMPTLGVHKSRVEFQESIDPSRWILQGTTSRSMGGETTYIHAHMHGCTNSLHLAMGQYCPPRVGLDTGHLGDVHRAIQATGALDPQSHQQLLTNIAFCILLVTNIINHLFAIKNIVDINHCFPMSSLLIVGSSKPYRLILRCKYPQWTCTDPCARSCRLYLRSKGTNTSGWADLGRCLLGVGLWCWWN